MATDRRPSKRSWDGAASSDAPATRADLVAAQTSDTAAQFSAMLRGSALPTAAVAVVCVVAAAVGGAKEAWSAGLGAALVVVFFSLSLLVMKRTATWEPTAVMGVVLGTYTAKIIALGVAMVLLRDASWLSGQALALSIIACTVVWLAFEMRAFTRMRVLVAPEASTDPTVDRSESADDGGEGR
jgi:ATP synthase protein I